MSNETGENRLKYGASPVSALVITILSLFCQWLNWFAFEKIDYPWQITLITPLLLCVMYHMVQLDAGSEGCFSRRFFYIFSAVVPLIIGILLSAAMFLADPTIFDPDTPFQGSISESIASYSGRFIVTSLYLVVFGIIDKFLLRLMEKE
ncbi:MAG: hypothetical protein II690_01675 [Ruminococcus sp.]|nr:hypothetical protein [Ruminococcus sp.]